MKLMKDPRSSAQYASALATMLLTHGKLVANANTIKEIGFFLFLHMMKAIL